MDEYDIRKNECVRYANALGLEVITDEYDHNQWECIAKGLEKEPERGGRCLQCFRFRLERAARYAHEHGFKVLATTLATSRWKDLTQVNAAGEYACSIFPDVTWWAQNWRKGGLQERRNQIIKEYGFYNQLYCGCEFSLAGRNVEELREKSKSNEEYEG
jgi:predicted adenine nucleotide alpha hydrolase (AANH) superfamily ATPase